MNAGVLSRLPLLRQILSHRRHVAVNRALDQIRRLRPGETPSRATISALHAAWGNPEFIATVSYLEAAAARAVALKGAVLECGSGLSTLLLGTLAERNGFSVDTGARSRMVRDRRGFPPTPQDSQRTSLLCAASGLRRRRFLVRRACGEVARGLFSRGLRRAAQLENAWWVLWRRRSDSRAFLEGVEHSSRRPDSGREDRDAGSAQFRAGCAGRQTYIRRRRVFLGHPIRYSKHSQLTERMESELISSFKESVN
jgi:hypothetical protein